MSIQDQGSGKYLITLTGNNPKNITLTLDTNSVGKCEPYEDPLPGGIPGRYPDKADGAPIHWLTNIKFRNVAQGQIPFFALDLPVISGSIYVFYNEVNKKLSTMDDKKSVKGSTVTYRLNQNDPSVGMT